MNRSSSKNSTGLANVANRQPAMIHCACDLDMANVRDVEISTIRRAVIEWLQRQQREQKAVMINLFRNAQSHASVIA
jgi:hypothetical protein